LPFAWPGHTLPISIVPPDADVPADTEPIRVPASWRLLATMNLFATHLLHRLSYALMRRFAFLEVPSPSHASMRKLLTGPADTIEVINPATEEVMGRAPDATAADVDRAVAAARRAFDEGPWPTMSVDERADALAKAADNLRNRQEEISTLITSEMGSPISFS